jgi:hypothetical protein
LTGACSNPNANDGTSCNDGNLCTQTDTCQGGVCTGGNPINCPAPDQCHDPGTCNPATGTCSNPPAADGTACNDGNLCTQTDTCQSGACVGGNPITCLASDQCHVAGACDPSSGTCSNPPAAAGTACNDGNACTVNDACDGAGVCVAGEDVCLDRCPEGDPKKSLLCVGRNGHGNKCCPTDSICDYSESGAVNCRNL